MRRSRAPPFWRPCVAGPSVLVGQTWPRTCSFGQCNWSRNSWSRPLLPDRSRSPEAPARFEIGSIPDHLVACSQAGTGIPRDAYGSWSASASGRQRRRRLGHRDHGQCAYPLELFLRVVTVSLETRRSCAAEERVGEARTMAYRSRVSVHHENVKSSLPDTADGRPDRSASWAQPDSETGFR